MVDEVLPGYAATNLVVIQASPFCNINCSYCYLPDRTTTHKISGATVDAIVDRLLEWGRLSRTVTVVWHAGEPLMLNGAFYADVLPRVDRLQRAGVAVTHAVQTNATHVTDDHCTVFRHHGVNVGVSLDGPAEVHDLYRRDRAGRGTFARAVRGIRTFQAHAIHPSAIAVLSKESMAIPERLYETFADLGIGFVGLNVPELEGVNRTSFLGDQDAAQAYTDFLEVVFRLSLRDGRVTFRELVNFVRPFVQGTTDENSEATPGAILSFSWNGKIGTYSPELLTLRSEVYGDFGQGDVHTTSIESVLARLCEGAIGRDIRQGVAACHSACDHFAVCGGGSPSNKLGEHGRLDTGETAQCRFAKKLLAQVACDILHDRRLLRIALDQVWRHMPSVARQRHNGSSDLQSAVTGKPAFRGGA